MHARILPRVPPGKRNSGFRSGRVEDKGRHAAGSRLSSKPAGNSPEVRNTVGQ